MGGERLLSFFQACEHIALHDPVNIHIPALEESWGALSITEMNRVEGRKEEEKKEEGQHISPDTDSLVLIQ